MEDSFVREYTVPFPCDGYLTEEQYGQTAEIINRTTPVVGLEHKDVRAVVGCALDNLKQLPPCMQQIGPALVDWKATFSAPASHRPFVLGEMTRMARGADNIWRVQVRVKDRTAAMLIDSGFTPGFSLTTVEDDNKRIVSVPEASICHEPAVPACMFEGVVPNPYLGQLLEYAKTREMAAQPPATAVPPAAAPPVAAPSAAASQGTSDPAALLKAGLESIPDADTRASVLAYVGNLFEELNANASELEVQRKAVADREERIKGLEGVAANTKGVMLEALKALAARVNLQVSEEELSAGTSDPKALALLNRFAIKCNSVLEAQEARAATAIPDAQFDRIAQAAQAYTSRKRTAVSQDPNSSTGATRNDYRAAFVQSLHGSVLS